MSAFVALFAALLSLHGLCSADDSGASGSADALLPGEWVRTCLEHVPTVCCMHGPYNYCELAMLFGTGVVRMSPVVSSD